MSVATAYAKALYEAGKDSKISAQNFDALEKQLEQFVELMNSSPAARTALLSPVTTAKEKAALIEEICKKASLPELINQFVALLARKGRLSLIREISSAFGSVRLVAEGGVSGELVAADPVSESDVKGLAEAFSRKLGKRVAFRVSTDPSLLAGMKVTVNGVTYDGTLRSQMQRLRDQLVFGYTNGHA